MFKITTINLNTIYIKIIVIFFIMIILFYLGIISMKFNYSISNLIQNTSTNYFIRLLQKNLVLNKVKLDNENQTKNINLIFKGVTSYLIGFDINNPQSILNSQMGVLSTGLKKEPDDLINYQENIEEYSEENQKNILQNSKLGINPQNIFTDDIIDTKGIRMINETKYSVDLEAFVRAPLTLSSQKEKPRILIYHTHTCESYTPSKKYNYIPLDNDRTTDLNYTVVKVGDKLTDTLKNMYNLEVVHDRTIHDRDVYNTSYTESANTVQKYIEDGYEFDLIIDIHRDAINLAGKKYRPIVTIDNKPVARIMTIIGTDSRGMPHTNWRQNLNLGVKFMDTMNKLYPGLARGINLKMGRFNQYLSTKSILVEVGANGNTLDEALSSTKYLAHTISEILNKW